MNDKSDNRNLDIDIYDKDLYIQQQKDFENLIINGNNSNYFVVEDFEASWGKSTFALNTLKKYKQVNPRKRILWVCERIKQCTDNAEDVNKIFNSEVSIAIIGGMSKNIRKESLEKYDIVFITAERYRRLCRMFNQEERNLFTDNRHLLIIDEKIEMCKEIKFSISKHSLLKAEIEKLAGATAGEIYNKIVASLVVSLKSTTKAKVINQGIVIKLNVDIKKIESLIAELKSIIDSKVENKSLFYANFEDKDYQTIFERIEDLREFFVAQIIMYFDKETTEVVMSVPNYSLEMFELENNIILDASASIDRSYIYKTDLFHVAYEEKIFNHSKWIVRWANINSTTYGRNNKYLNFTQTLNNIIVNVLGESNTLVFATKYDDVRPTFKGSIEYEKVNKFKGTVTHNGVITSNNEFFDLKNYINADLNYADEKSYVLKYLYYSGNEILSWKSGRNGFINKELHLFKIYDIARGLYQSIKRINRNLEFESIVVFLCHKQEIQDIVFSMFKGVNIEHSQEIEDMFEEIKKTNIEQFIDICKQLQNKIIPNELLKIIEKPKFKKYEKDISKGIFAKCIFAESLGISTKSFSNNVLNNKTNTTARDFLRDNNIHVTNKSINFKGF